MDKILPYILATFTGTRYKPEIKWSSKSWTHNVFRAYEAVFWRKAGIRIESSSWVDIDEDGVYHEKTVCYSWEATIAHTETLIRRKIRELTSKFKNIRFPNINIDDYQPAFAFEGISYVPKTKEHRSGYLFAIAVDASTSGTYGTSPRSFSHTCTGSDLVLMLAGFSFGTGTTATYNSVSMSNLGTYSYLGSRYGCLDYLLGPATGSNTVVFTPGGDGIPVVVSYTGVAQSGQPDAAINTQTTNSGTSLTATVTVTASGSWLMAGTITEGAGVGAGTGATLRITGSNVAVAFFDSNGAPGTGSQSMTVTESSTAFAIGMVSIAPAASSAIKTIDGLAKASVKTVDGLVIASVKTWNGLA